MISGTGKSIRSLFVSIALISVLIIPQKAMAHNRAINVKIIEQDERVRCAILLEGKPRYSLGPVKGNILLLTLQDTLNTPLLNKNAARYTNSLSIDEDEQSFILRFRIKLSAPLREINSSWLSGEKLLYLDMFTANNSGAHKTALRGGLFLKNVRFGIKDKYTRMVLGLDRRPSWEMVYHGPGMINMRIKATSKFLKGKKFGPIKRLKEILLSQNGDMTDIRIQLESYLNKVRIFWLKDGSKLVMDLADMPGKIDDDSLLLTPDKDEKKETAVIQAEEQAGKIEEKSSASEKKEAAGMGYFVKMKIPGRDEKEINLPKNAGMIHPPAKKDSILFESELKDIFPGGIEEKASVHRLRPAEAILFGRILEAQEYRDYNKGIQLMERFLNRFPDSPLNENIAFLRGDFQFILLEEGNREIYSQIVKGYKEAIERFGESREVPKAYIRMAQAASLMGKNHEAIGYLNLVINRGGSGEHLPLAHLIRGKLYLRTNQPEKAVRDLKTIMERYPGSPPADEVPFVLANYFFSVGVYEEAERRLKEIGDSNPLFYLKHPEYLFQRAKVYLYLNKYDLAREYLFKALNIGRQPETSDLLICRIGDTYHHQSKEREAERFYRLVINDYPESEGASIAKLRLASYSPGTAALEELKNKYAEKPIGDLVQMQIAKKYYAQKQYSMAMGILEKLLKRPVKDQINAEAKRLFIKSAEKKMKQLYRKQEYKALIDFYWANQKQMFGNTDPEVLLQVALSYCNLNKFREAIPVFLKIKPYDLSNISKGRYILSLAQSYMKEGDNESAEKLLKKYRKQSFPESDHQKMTILLADILREKGNLKDAYNLYQGLVNGKRLLPDSEIARAYLEMGNISKLEGNHEDAREALNRYIALMENNKENMTSLQSAILELGNSYYGEGKHRQALKSFQRVLDYGYGPDKPDFWDLKFKMAMSYIATGEKEKAEPILNEISENGDPILQQMALMKLGMSGLEKELKRLSIWPEIGE